VQPYRVLMTLRSITALSLVFLAGCGPSYVGGDDADTARRLLELVPQGSSLNDLRAEAARREWRCKSEISTSSTPGSHITSTIVKAKVDRLFRLLLRIIGVPCEPSLKLSGYIIPRKGSWVCAFDVALMLRNARSSMSAMGRKRTGVRGVVSNVRGHL
jgi:hypothetical protein